MTSFHVLTESDNIKYIFLDVAEEMYVTLAAGGSMWFLRVYVDTISTAVVQYQKTPHGLEESSRPRWKDMYCISLANLYKKLGDIG